MPEWRKYKRSNKYQAKPLTITFGHSRGIVFRTNVSCFHALGLDPKGDVRADVYFKDGTANIVPHGNGEIAWRPGTSAGTAFRNEGWDVEPGTRYKATAGKLFGEPALIVKRSDKL